MDSTSTSDSDDVAPLLDHVVRHESVRLRALLTRLLGPARLALVDDVTQDAILTALRVWPVRGTPANPTGWLLHVARRKALDALRRDQSLSQFEGAIAHSLERSANDSDVAELSAEGLLADDELRLVFLCSHPLLSLGSRVALTLKTAAGFSVTEIARALVSDEKAIAQRLVRAKRSLRDAQASFDLPSADDIDTRLDAVLEVLYLMFNEGYSATEGEELLRRDLARESLRLVELLLDHPPTAQPRVFALASLFCFHASRFDARTDSLGAVIRLADQDRARWDTQLLARGLRYLQHAASGDCETTYHIEAEIACCHAVAPSWKDTDWPRILFAYDRLLALTTSPVAALNRIVAVRAVRGDHAALRELTAISRLHELREYPLLHAIHGELLAATGKGDEAAAHFRRAVATARSIPIRRLAQSRLDELERGDVDSGALRSSLV